MSRSARKIKDISWQGILKLMMVSIVICLMGTVTVGAIYGLLTSLNLLVILLFTCLIILLPISIILQRIIRERYRFLPFILSKVVLLSLVIWNKDINVFSTIACSTQQAISIGNAFGHVNEAKSEVRFCGYLQICNPVVLTEEEQQYEVCLITDLWDEEISIQYYTDRLTQSNDPLVQISNESRLLQNLSTGTLVIDAGFYQRSNQCVFSIQCDSGVSPVATVWRTYNPIP